MRSWLKNLSWTSYTAEDQKTNKREEREREKQSINCNFYIFLCINRVRSGQVKRTTYSSFTRRPWPRRVRHRTVLTSGWQHPTLRRKHNVQSLAWSRRRVDAVWTMHRWVELCCRKRCPPGRPALDRPCCPRRP